MTAIRPVPKPLDRPIRLAVPISGGGTTLANFIEKIAARSLDAEIGVVIASAENCGGIEKARRAGLHCEIVPRKAYSNRHEFSAEVFRHCRDARADLVALGGFLCQLCIPADFEHRMMNVHPALIPSFCGKGFYGQRVHKAVLERGVKISGCTVHFVDDEYDHGPIIVQRTVPVLDEDTPETLAARVFEQECEAYPEAIRLFAAGQIEIENGRTRIGRPVD